MRTVVIHPKILYFGTPVALITTLNADGSPNIGPMSSAWALADRVVLGLSTFGQTFENLVRDGECVINLPASGQWRQVERIAATTGRDPVPDHKRTMGYRHESDKLTLGEFESVLSECVRPPRLRDCPLQIEAHVLAIHPLTQHANGSDVSACRVVEVEVRRVHAHTAILHADTGHVDVSAWSPLLYVFRHYFGTGPDLGKNFRSET